MRPTSRYTLALTDGPRQPRGLLRPVYRAAPHPDVQPPARQPPGRVQVDAQPQHLAPVRGDRGVDEVELLQAVHHQGDPAGEARVGTDGPQRRPVRGRVGDEDVVGHPVLDQPDGFRQAERHHAGPARRRQYPAQQRAAPHRLARHPDARTGGARGHRGGVRVERRQVDDRERRIELGGRPVETGTQPVCAGHGGGHTSHASGIRG